MMPGFIDPHSHVIQQSLKFSVVNLDPHPIGDVKSIADIQRKLKERIKERCPNPVSGSLVGVTTTLGWRRNVILLGTTSMRWPPNIRLCSCT